MKKLMVYLQRIHFFHRGFQMKETKKSASAVNGKFFFFGVGISAAKPDAALFFTTVALILAFFPVRTAVGEEVSLDEAARLAVSGEYAAAEERYSRLLEAEPDRLEARLGRAHVRSWQGKHASAEEDFLAVLKKEPENVDALTGLGYSLAWSGRLREGEERFRQSLRIEPGRRDALDGIEIVRKAEEKGPDGAEAAARLGWEKLASGHHRQARRAFLQALALEPDRPDALVGIAAVRRAPTPLEISVWGGHTFNGGDTGLRSLELAGWPSRDLRLWSRYDNALSLDNPALVRQGKKIPSLFAGGLANWREKYTTKLEVGLRELPDRIGQILSLAEQVIYLSEGRLIKAGGLLGRRDDGRTDWNAYLGFGFPASPRLRLEPTLFYTRTGVFDENEKRFLLVGEHQFERGERIGAGVALGKFESELPGASGGLWAAHLIGMLPLGNAHHASFLIRRETPPNGEAFTTIALGLTFRLERE